MTPKNLTVEYSEMVLALAKPGETILETATPSAMHLLHMAVGFSGELAELWSAMMVPSSSWDLANVKEELGDLQFYLEGVYQAAASPRFSVPEQVGTSPEKVDRGLRSLIVLAGDLLDVAKRYAIYGKPLEQERLAALLPEIETALSLVRSMVATRSEIMEVNMAKLAKRYKSGRYSDAQANARQDKAE